MKIPRACLAFVLVLSLGVGASAAVRTAQVLLDGLQESPPVATPGTGSATVTFDDITGAMSVIGSFSSLIGTSTNAHVHGYAALGDPPAGVVFGISFDPGVTSGNFSGNGVIPGNRIQDVLNGLTYINVHSTFRTGGEIRGQILNLRIPEPATGVLVGLSVLAATIRRYR